MDDFEGKIMLLHDPIIRIIREGLNEEEIQILETLPKLKREILTDRLLGGTYLELAKKYRLTQEKIRMIEMASLNIIHNAIKLGKKSAFKNG